MSDPADEVRLPDLALIVEIFMSFLAVETRGDRAERTVDKVVAQVRNRLETCATPNGSDFVNALGQSRSWPIANLRSSPRLRWLVRGQSGG